MLTYTVGPDGQEDLQGQWTIKETFAGDSLRLFVLAEKNGIEKKMWVNRSDLQEAEGPDPAGLKEITEPTPDSE